MSLHPHVRQRLLAKLIAATRPDTAYRRLLAILRRSLAQPPGEDLRTVAELESGLFGDYSERDRRHYYLVAGLFALHSKQADGVDIGHAFRRLQQDHPNAADSLTRRMAALVDADDAQLPERLRHAIQLLRQAEIGLDFAALLDDLLAWKQRSRRVQQRWLRHFLLRPAAPTTDGAADSVIHATNA